MSHHSGFFGDFKIQVNSERGIHSFLRIICAPFFQVVFRLLNTGMAPSTPGPYEISVPARNVQVANGGAKFVQKPVRACVAFSTQPSHFRAVQPCAPCRFLAHLKKMRVRIVVGRAKDKNGIRIPFSPNLQFLLHYPLKGNKLSIFPFWSGNPSSGWF